MANEEHLAKLREGVISWNQWRKSNYDVRPYLHGADLSGADLNGAYLSLANLVGAKLIKTDLNGADLNGADLNGADLNGADLSGADLRNARLVGANLSGADLSRTNLSGADLRDIIINDLTNLSEVKVDRWTCLFEIPNLAELPRLGHVVQALHQMVLSLELDRGRIPAKAEIYMPDQFDREDLKELEDALIGFMEALGFELEGMLDGARVHY